MLNRTGAVIYVGNLPDDIRERELDDLFYKARLEAMEFGRIVSVDLKSPAVPPPFAFVEFDHPRAAADAVIARNGYEFGGARLRVEHAHRGAAGGGGFGGGGGGYGGGYGPPPYGGGYGGGYGGPPPRGGYGPPPRNPARISSHRCIVSGLPSSTSWQDLKDFFRKSITPEYTDIQRVDRDRVRGIVEFATREDLKRAIRDLDDTEFSNRFDKAYVRITDDSQRSRSRSPRDRSPRGRSRSRDARSMSRSRSPRRRTLSRSVSRSRSPVRRDDSRSRSRSPVKSVSPARSPEKEADKEADKDLDKDLDDNDREKSASPAKSDD